MNFVKLGVGGALIFLGMRKYVKNQAFNTALIYIGAVTLAAQVPTANRYLL